MYAPRLHRSVACFLVLLIAAVSVSMASALVFPRSHSAEAQAVVRAINVEGNQRVDDATVISYMTVEVGRTYTSAAADQSLKALFDTGLFSDVTISLRGSTVVIVVVENPVVNRVAFEGNRKLNADFLSEQVQLQPSATFTRAKVQADTQLIQALYRRSGRFGARVTPKIIELDRNRVNLVFEIDEGDKTGVRRISFIGNQAFSEGTLREVVSTTETNFLSFLRSTDIYDPQRLEADQEALRRFYLTKGYADFRVISAIADFDPEEGAFFITITVDEGPKYKFGDITIETFLRELDPDQLMRFVETETGKTYDAELVDETLEALTVEVSTQGYAFARVRPTANRDVETRTISIVYTIEEGPRVFVERIEIRGNTRTLDRVIRREFDIAEGDPYNQVLIDRGERNLNRLNYFERVRVRRRQGSAPDLVVVVIDVVEQPTGELSLGGGFSTSEGVIGDVSITERNLLGRGQSVRLALGLSSRRTNIDFSITEPWFLDRRVSAGIDLFYRDIDREDESSFNNETWGGGFRFGFLVARDLTMNLRYRLEFEDITLSSDDKPDFDEDGDGNLEDPNESGFDETGLSADDIRALAAAGTTVVPTEVSPFILNIEGESTTSLAGVSFVFDRLDFPRNPRNGYIITTTGDVAGLGGDQFYVRGTAEARAYREILPNIILVGRLRGGLMESLDDDEVQIQDSFFEGPDLVRGFETSGLGPRAQRTLAGSDGVLGTGDDIVSSEDALGGTAFWGATAEVRFPVPLLPRSAGLGGAVFTDVGSLFNVGELGDLPTSNSSVSWSVLDESAPRASVGFGVLWNSPFGPLRADLAWPILEEDFDETQVFRFSGGTRF